MNIDKLTKYFELLLQRDRSASDHMYDAMTDMLDDLWYGFTPEELTYVKQLLSVDRNNPRLHRITNILTTLKENTMNTDTKTHASVFESKEDYLKLRTFWKQFHAEGKHKAVKVEYRTSKPFQSGYANGEMAFHMESPLTLMHHLIYLAAMGKPLDKAFSEWTTRETKNALYDWKYWNPNPSFKLFGDAIDKKYDGPIMRRIQDYLDSQD